MASLTVVNRAAELLLVLVTIELVLEENGGDAIVREGEGDGDAVVGADVGGTVDVAGEGDGTCAG